MKFVVTGGAGFIGSYLVKQLVKHGYEVVVIDSLIRGRLDNITSIDNDVVFHKIDIRDFDGLRRLLKNANGVFHEAALTDVQESFTMQKEYHQVNVVGTENIFKVAKEFGLKVVYASSSSVYGNPKVIPIKETAGRAPINPYGMTKLEDEFLAEKYWDDVPIIGLRYFNVYGRGQTNSYAGVITKFINRLGEKKPPIIYGDGKQVRDFVYVEDVAMANIAAMRSEIKSGFFNVGTGLTTSIQELAEVLIELSGLSVKPTHQTSLEGDVRSSQADTTLSKNLLGWRYQTSLNDGLRKFFPL
jgi:UDP-glucose 4-epimerase